MANESKDHVVSVHIEKREGAGVFGDDLYRSTVTLRDGTTRSSDKYTAEQATSWATHSAKNAWFR